MKAFAIAIVALAILFSTRLDAGGDPATNDVNTAVQPVWIGGAAGNDAARNEAFQRLTDREKDRVVAIRGKLKTGGFTSLLPREVQFAYRGDGYKCLFWELADAIKAHPDALTDQGRKLLRWDDATTITFACELNLAERTRILRLGETLVNRDRQLSDREIKIARDNRYLSGAFDKYMKLGLDPSKVAERKRKIAEECTAKIADLQPKIADLQAKLPALEKQSAKDNATVKQLESRLSSLTTNSNISLGDPRQWDAVAEQERRTREKRDKIEESLSAAREQAYKSSSAVDDCKSKIKDCKEELAAVETELNANAVPPAEQNGEQKPASK